MARILHRGRLLPFYLQRLIPGTLKPVHLNLCKANTCTSSHSFCSALLCFALLCSGSKTRRNVAQGAGIVALLLTDVKPAVDTEQLFSRVVSNDCTHSDENVCSLHMR